MYGFYSDFPPHDSSHTMIVCPNCGVLVPRSALAQHACVDENIEAHHVSLLSREFMPLEGGHPNTGQDRAIDLLRWKPLSEWLETPQGQFAVYHAQRGH